MRMLRRGFVRRWRLAVGAIGGVGAALVTLPSCEVAMPFRGPWYSSGDGVTLPGVGEEVMVGVTNAVLGGPNRDAFDESSRRVVESLPTHDGFIGYSLRTRVLGSEVWTMTVWRDKAALDAFVRSPVHRSAMREGMSAITAAKFLRMPWPTKSVPPRWSEVLERLKTVEPMDSGEATGAGEKPTGP